MSRRRSVIVDVDGEPVRVCGVSGDLDPKVQAAIVEVVRAAKAAAEELPQQCMARDETRSPVALPCLRESDHEPPHRTGTGREW